MHYLRDEWGMVSVINCSQSVSTLLTHWGRVTHICVSKLNIIGSDNGLSPGRRQAIIWTNDGILLIRTLRTHFSEIVSEIHTFSFKKTHFKMSSGKWRPSCLGLNVLKAKCHRWLNYILWVAKCILSTFCLTHWPLGDIDAILKL